MTMLAGTGDVIHSLTWSESRIFAHCWFIYLQTCTLLSNIVPTPASLSKQKDKASWGKGVPDSERSVSALALVYYITQLLPHSILTAVVIWHLHKLRGCNIIIDWPIGESIFATFLRHNMNLTHFWLICMHTCTVLSNRVRTLASLSKPKITRPLEERSAR